MDKQTQIEEMTNIIFESSPIPELWRGHANRIAKALYYEGYGNHSEVAREIISDIEMLLSAYTDDSERTKELSKLIELIKRYLTTYIRKKYEVTEE